MKPEERLHALDAVRGFALLAGVVLHATMSFLPGFAAVGWPIADRSPSIALGLAFYVIHMFRMTMFFLIAGFFGRMLFHRGGARGFVRNRAIRILIPLVVGWIAVFPLIVMAFSWAAARSTAGPLTTSPPQPPGYLAFPLTHLWFLYVLVLVYAATLAGRELFIRAIDPTGAVRTRLDGWAGSLVRGPVAFAVVGVPLAVALSASPLWARWFGIPTPDQSLLPNLPATVAFGTAFLFGWLVHRQPDLLKVWERRWAIHLAIALVMTAVSLSMVGVSPVFTPAAPDQWAMVYAAVLHDGHLVVDVRDHRHGATVLRQGESERALCVRRIVLGLHRASAAGLLPAGGGSGFAVALGDQVPGDRGGSPDGPVRQLPLVRPLHVRR